jgi:hypothetical protein
MLKARMATSKILRASVGVLACTLLGCSFDSSGMPGPGSVSNSTLAADDTSGDSTGVSGEQEADTEDSGSSDATDGDDVVPADAELQISSEPFLDFGFTLLDETSTQTLVVENTGGVVASGIVAQSLAHPFSFLGRAFPGDGGSCQHELAPGETCTIVVAFQPGRPAIASAEIVLSYQGLEGVREAKRTVTGGGVSDNLIVNAGGEAGGTPPVGWIPVGPGSWTATACERAAPFGAPPGSPLAGDRCLGHADLPQGAVGDVVEIQQFVMLPDWDELIDAGLVRFELSSHARSRETGNDDWRVRAVFLDATAGLEPMFDTLWRTTTDWEAVEAAAVAPPTTRRVIIRLYCRMQLTGDHCDAFFDELFLRAVPDSPPGE